MISLIYVSSAVEPFSKADLLTLLEPSRCHNALLDMTGLLLYKDGNFMQVIEGHEPAIHKPHTKISLNPRHDGLITLLEKPIEPRTFSDWSMGFKDLFDPHLRETPGHSEFLTAPLTSAEFSAHPSRAQQLLTSQREDVTGR